MFDIFITSSDRLDVKNIFSRQPKYRDIIFSERFITLGEYNVSFLSRTTDNLSIATRDGKTLLIYGKVLPRFSYEAMFGESLDASELIDVIINDKLFYQKIKGHFVLFWFNNTDSSLEVITDHFGYKPIYFGTVGDDFIICSNLNLIRHYFDKTNNRVMFEKIFFTFSITDETFIDGFSQLPAGTKTIFRKGKFHHENLFDLENFIFSSKSNRFDLNEFITILNSAVRVRSFQERPFCSVTGGFDGRVILSSMLNQNISPSTYSFGKTGGQNTEVPILINSLVPINYSPIYLEEDFETNYSKYALDALYFSDGMSTFERSNYCYSYQKLRAKTEYIITGLIGGEVFGPVSQMHDYLNPKYFNILYSTKEQSPKSISSSEIKPFYNQNVADDVIDNIFEILLDRRAQYLDYKNSNNSFLIYLYDLLTVGFKRFYGAELHLTRVYFENLTPMFDIDVLEYLINSSHKNIYKNSFKSYNINRWQNRLLHSRIIYKNYSELAYIKVDRGFSPIELIDKTKRFKAILSYFTQKKSRDVQSPDFNSSHWVGIFFRDLSANLRKFDSEMFNIPKVVDYFEKYSVPSYNRTVNSALSLVLWEVLFKE